MEPKTKQYLLVTVVGVTLFVALLRLSAVLAFAADLVDLILPIPAVHYVQLKSHYKSFYFPYPIRSLTLAILFTKSSASSSVL